MISFNDAFTWFNFFEGPSLKWPVIFLRDLALRKIRERKFSEAYQLIEYMEKYQNTIDDKYERGEIWLECSMAYYDMGNPLQAVKAIKMAERVYTQAAAGSHKCAVICWMLGTVQWETEIEAIEALRNWSGAIGDFDLLKRLAEEESKPLEVGWYVERILEMEENLQEKILEKFS